MQAGQHTRAAAIFVVVAWVAAVALQDAILSIEWSEPHPHFVAFFIPSLVAGMLVGTFWRGALALLTIAIFAWIHPGEPSWSMVVPAMVGGTLAGIAGGRLVRRAAGAERAARAPASQSGALALRVQQAAVPPFARRIVTRSAVDDAIDLVRLRLDTFPHGIYHPVPGLPVRAAKRADGSRSRWRAMEPTIDRLHVETAMDIGTNAGYFCIKLAERGVTTVGIDFDPACVRTVTTAVRRNRLDNVAILSLELRPDMVRLLPTADCSILLSVWHHLVRFQGLEVASYLLAEVWARTEKVMFFDTGEDEMPESFGLPAMTPTAHAWLAGYLRATCPGSSLEHLGRHAAFDADGREAERNLFAVVREHASARNGSGPGPGRTGAESRC